MKKTLPLLSLLLFLFYGALAQTNTISGIVFLDKNTNSVVDNGDIFQPAVRIHLYNDIDLSQSVSGPDVLLSTNFTDGTGTFSFASTGGASLDFQVDDDDDDAEEFLLAGAVDIGDNELDVSTNGLLESGIRFRNVGVPQGATITAAYLEFTAKNNDNAPTDMTIHGELAVNSAIFTTSSANISSRSKTVNVTNWPSVPSWSRDNVYQTPSLINVVQEIVNQGGWVAGNAMTFTLNGTQGNRRIRSHDNSSSRAPRLHIEYYQPENYVVAVEPLDLSSGFSMTTPTSYPVAFTAPGQSDIDNYFGYDGVTVGCFAVADNGNNLWLMNRFSGHNETISPVSVSNIEAVAFNFNRTVLYGADADQLGIIDLVTGGFTALPNQFGSGTGSLGSRTFDDVDGLYADPLTGVFYGSQANGTGSSDLLFQIDPGTGLAIPDAFGAGTDYIVLTGTGVFGQIDDIAIEPTTGQMFAINNDGSTYQLLRVDKATGASVVVGPTGVYDIEGLGFADDGSLYGTTGNSSGAGTTNSLYQLSTTTGSATLVSTFTGDSDYEACECQHLPPYNGIVLPVEFLSFAGQLNHGNVRLDWITANENNNSHFEVQRSMDNGFFETIKMVDRKEEGSSFKSYATIDDRPAPGENFYRLKQVDLNGTSSFSKTIKIVLDQSNELALDIFPNPSNGHFNLSVAALATEGNVRIFDMKGSLIHQEKIVAADFQVLELDFQHLKPGMYLMELATAGQSVAKRILIH